MTAENLDATSASRRIIVDGLEVVAYFSGPEDGQPYILIHGLGMASAYFQPLARELERHGRVIRLNLPGFGPAKDPNRALRISHFGRVARRAVEHLGVTDAVWVGHSMGTQVVVEAVADHPGLAKRVVLLAPVINVAERGLFKVVRRFTAAAIHEPLGSAAESAKALTQCGLRYVLEVFPAVLHYPIEERIRAIDAPVQIVIGGKDALTPTSWARKLAKACNQPAEIEVMKNSAHQMMFTHPHEVASLIAAVPAQWESQRLSRRMWRFLREVGAGARAIIPKRRGAAATRRNPACTAPVLLLPGILERPGYLDPLRNALEDAGHLVIEARQLGWNLGSLEQSAEVAWEALDGMEPAVIVAHSKGGLIGKKMLTDPRAKNRLLGMVSFATPYQGSQLWPTVQQLPFLRRSPLGLFEPSHEELVELERHLDVNERIVALSPAQDPIVPNGSNLVGATNITLPQEGHFAPLRDPQVWQIIHDHIDALAGNVPASLSVGSDENFAASTAS